MMVASNRLGGATINRPDPCLSTWTNFAFMADAATFSPNIFFSGGNAIFQASVLSVSHGDEVDTPVYIPTIGPCIFPIGIPTILLNGIPAVAMMTASISNAGNATQGGVAIPSPTNVLMLYDQQGTGDAAAGRVTDLELGEIGGALRRQDAIRLELSPHRVGLLAVDLFDSSAASRLYGAVRSLVDRGAEALVIDLRGNPGGDALAAIEAAGDFLEPGTLVATLVDEDGDARDYRARAGSSWRLPLVVLVDDATASSAELFAGALQAHGRALVFGKRTVGKGVAQRLAADGHGAGVQWQNVATVRLPSGAALHGAGIEPDVCW